MRFSRKMANSASGLMEPMEEVVYLDQVKLLAVDHPANMKVFPNEYFASNPPYPAFKVVASRMPRVPAGVWDDIGHNLLPQLLRINTSATLNCCRSKDSPNCTA